MAKVNNKTKGFNSISRDLVFDNELSDRARFVYVYMACKPEGWEFYQDKVAAELGYGKDTLRKYLDELITRGWITENEQQNDGKFGCLEYDIEVERKKGNLPIRKKADTEKSRNGKIPNQRNIDSISSKQSLSDNKDIEKKKELSCDNSKKTKEGYLFSNVTDEKEKNYLEHMYEHYPLIMKMDKPLTYNEFKTLRENYDVDLVWDKMDNLENTKNMRKKYVSAYLTLNNWCKMSFNREPKKKEDEQ